ncbi:hypothetical protein PR202_ga03257 [Eleusine coracana subsp. coracana]|uniref:Uncharacterized protein n=1 Tax=Eleusine coracana subsp. coracana TaxID=191504 RepID=A0AAV5BLH8_ELECO|nr:hypothetical protein PR202_ga03257 [Eleusine coracana subsp. coracana]
MEARGRRRVPAAATRGRRRGPAAGNARRGGGGPMAVPSRAAEARDLHGGGGEARWGRARGRRGSTVADMRGGRRRDPGAANVAEAGDLHGVEKRPGGSRAGRGGGDGSMWLDRETGVKRFMLSARKLNIAWGNTPCYWRWIPITGSSFSEAAELLTVCWLEILGRIDSKMLSKNSTYSVYLVFKVAGEAYGLQHPEQNTCVRLGGIRSSRRVCLDGYDSDGEDRASEFYHSLPCGSLLRPTRRSRLEIPQDVLLPKERPDG